MFRQCCRFVVAIIVLVTATNLRSEMPLYPSKTDPDRGKLLRERPWIETIRLEVPELKHPVGDRLPMIMWHGVGYDELSEREITILRTRGLTQHLPFDVDSIPAAKKLQDAGLPVILMEGRTDSWPYSLSEDYEYWAHQFDLNYQPKWFADPDAFEWHGACPSQTKGWEILAKQTRETMNQFRDAGVQVIGVWVDYEGDPYPWGHAFEQIKHCKRCRSQLPSEVLGDQAAWRNYSWRKYVDLYDKNFAKPIREVFPECLVTNWHVVFSTKENPIRYFVRDENLPVLKPMFFNAANPIAYGCDLTWHERTKFMVVDHSADFVNDFYRKEILQQVKTDRANQLALGRTEVRSIPWVARFCKIDTQNRKTPIMIREAYRSTLVEFWREGITTMQVFNPMHAGYEEFALMELQDAVLALDEALAEKSRSK